MSVFGLLAAVVADDFVDLYDDILGDAGLFGSAIDHLCEVDALLVRLSDRDLAEYFIFASNYDADEITGSLYKSGLTIAAIQQQLSIKSKSTVYRLLRLDGIELGRK